MTIATRFHPVGAAVRLLAAVGLAGLCMPANAIGLLAAYDAALQHDPAYRSAFFAGEAGKEYRNIGRASLLPSVSMSYSGSRNHADTSTASKDVLGRPVTNEAHPEYISRSSSLTLRQPLVSFEAAARYRQGVAQSDASDADFSGSTKEFALRLVGAYFDALFAQEQVQLAEATRALYQEQRKVNDLLFAKGEGTRTDMIETQARLDLSEAQLLEAHDNELNMRVVLSALVGEEVTALDRLAPDFRAQTGSGRRFDEWKALTLAHNAAIESQRHAVEAAREEINKGRAGHMPRLDLVGTYSKNGSESLNTLNQDSTNRTIGIQLSVPVYAGGYYSAVTRQAVAGHERAKAELQSRIDKALAEVRKEFNLLQSGAARVEALTKAVASNQLLVQATEQSIKGGVRINLDLLNARQQLLTSQRDLAQARYGYLLSGLRLRAVAGILNYDDVREVAAHFR